MTPDDKWQLIRNRFHTYGNPISVAKMERVYGLLDLPGGASVLDVGCGKGEVLLRLVERFGVRAVGVDPSAVLEVARGAAAERVPDGDLTWHRAKIQDVAIKPGSFDLTVCIGASHAFGAYDDMLAGLIRLTRPGGLVLVADGFRAGEPDPEYVIGSHADFTTNDNFDNIAAAEAHGLRTLYNTISSRDEWDEFEWLYMYAMEQHAHEHGLTPEQEQRLVETRAFQAQQQRFGRDAMGFALYLFRLPSDVAR